ncbi:diguanylate cyclase [Pelomonas sp. SE-A7]|uniref:diguanylate cyclase domain-containing protein n=1 Tax=Pelomonas sp. SE-A7 TaxID=3054953 RepID=UPI00259C9436|nr:diguanylate cyclase [Pelomonas sp. SE-A7]MDM4765080.1 diguanylate cyclase [Pelomonas sp. SE-A7]
MSIGPIASSLTGALLDGLSVGIVVLDRDKQVLHWNAWMARSSAIPSAQALGQPLNLLLPELQHSFLARSIDSALQHGRSAVLSQALHKTLLPLSRRIGDQVEDIQQSVQVRPLLLDGGERGCLIQVIDVSQSWRREKLLLASEQRLRALLGHLPQKICYRDGSDHWLEANPRWLAWCGLANFHYRGLDDAQIAKQRPACALQLHRIAEWSEAAWQSRDPQEHELELQVQGESRCYHVLLVPAFEQDGRRKSLLVIVRDISEVKAKEARIRQLAETDALTGLANRNVLQDRLTQQIEQSDERHQVFGLLFVDLDGFKGINDQFGHEAGDRLLRAVAQRMQARLRASDTLCRWGGDEFVVLMSAGSQAEAVARVAQQLIGVIATPVQLDDGGSQGSVGASIGVAVYPHHGRSAAALLQAADAAMYRAKTEGKSRYALAEEASSD